MNISIYCFGICVLDLTIGPTTQTDDDADDSGYTASTPVGFVVAHDVPDEATILRPVSPWEDDSGA